MIRLVNRTFGLVHWPYSAVLKLGLLGLDELHLERAHACRPALKQAAWLLDLGI